jgi:hypothetical protein
MNAVLMSKVETHFQFALRMVDAATFELGQGRPVESRAMIYNAIEQLDRAVTVIWEFEQHGREQAPSGNPPS